MRFGEFELVSLSDGFFRLDGGAMFGVIPKPLWEKRAPADERNRILMGMRPLLVRAGGRQVLIDAGSGDKMGPKELDIYGFDRPPDEFSALLGATFRGGDIACR